MPSLFLSYRRADSPDMVKLLFERLKQRLKRWEIFYDHQSIKPGEVFPEKLAAKVRSATAVLVIIGPQWLEILRQRRSEAVDHVRSEVQLALLSGASVVPVVVGRTVLPTAADLAEFPDLLPLLHRNALSVRSDPDFDGDMEAILSHLEELVAGEVLGATLADKYTLTAEIGQGGMGVVYAAEQKEPVHRIVAVKLIKPGMDSREVLARFDTERQALAVMDHQNIARVLDAGALPNGRPYFVMEFVKGVPITQYCDDRKLTPHERLRLFIPLCNAVQHAHQKGIIHRDLKPSNVLVEVIDGKPVPKVIDFGLAKALGRKLTELTLHTAADTRVGTLEYSSPEQAAGRAFEVDTRSDIYSLGVLLYELLTGAPPFTRAELLKIGEEEMRRVIREVEPMTPSKRLSSSGELPAISAKRQVEPSRLPRLIRGDLDWIVMKCLAKEQSRRYETANQVGQELQRFLDDEPVQVGYRFRKFLRRNKGVTIAAALTFLVLVAGIIGTTIGLAEARRAEASERQERIKAQRAAEDADDAREKLATEKAEAVAQLEHMRTLVDSLRGRPVSDPLTDAKAGFQTYMAVSYQRLGKFKEAIVLFRQVHDDMLDLHGRDHPDTLKSKARLAAAYFADKQLGTAIPMMEETLSKRRIKLGKEHADTLESIAVLALAYLDNRQNDEAISLYVEVVAVKRKQFKTLDPRLADQLGLLALELLSHEQYNAAEPMLRECLDIRKLQPDTWSCCSTKAMLGCCLCGQKKYLDAEPLLREGYEGMKMREKLAPSRDRPRLVEALRQLVSLYRETGNFNEFDRYNRELASLKP